MRYTPKEQKILKEIKDYQWFYEQDGKQCWRTIAEFLSMFIAKEKSDVNCLYIKDNVSNRRKLVAFSKQDDIASTANYILELLSFLEIASQERLIVYVPIEDSNHNELIGSQRDNVIGEIDGLDFKNGDHLSYNCHWTDRNGEEKYKSVLIEESNFPFLCCSGFFVVTAKLKKLVEDNFITIEDKLLKEAKTQTTEAHKQSAEAAKQSSEAKRQTLFSYIAISLSIISIICSICVAKHITMEVKLTDDQYNGICNKVDDVKVLVDSVSIRQCDFEGKSTNTF